MVFILYKEQYMKNLQLLWFAADDDHVFKVIHN
jgi:hypothetical protein